jgi:predicted dehydrogenase
MRLALLCDDSSVAPWIEALVEDPLNEVTDAALLTPEAAQLCRRDSGIRVTSQWEDLLTRTSLDATIVGGSAPQTLDGIKQLAGAGQTLLFVPSFAQGSTFIYELSLIRDDNRVPIHPAVWHRCDPVLIQLREWIRQRTLGQVQLLQMHRTFPAKESSTSQVAQSAIDAELLLDFDLLRWLIGDYDQILALRTGATEAGVLTQSVKLSGRDLPEATWDGCAGKSRTCRLTVHTEKGPVVLEQGEETPEWVLTEPDGTRHTGNRQSAIREYLRRLQSSEPAPMDWSELVKAFETVDATHRSVRRRRVIELHFEPMSERAIFKTQMTAIGCSVLVGTFMLVLAYLAIASTIQLPTIVLFVLRTLVFLPLGIFLFLQILYPLTRPSDTEP